MGFGEGLYSPVRHWPESRGISGWGGVQNTAVACCLWLWVCRDVCFGRKYSASISLPRPLVGVDGGCRRIFRSATGCDRCSVRPFPACRMRAHVERRVGGSGSARGLVAGAIRNRNTHRHEKASGYGLCVGIGGVNSGSRRLMLSRRHDRNRCLLRMKAWP